MASMPRPAVDSSHPLEAVSADGLPQLAPKFLAGLQQLAALAALLVALTGVAGLVAWVLQSQRLAVVLPGHVTIRPTSGALFLLAGTSLWLLGRQQAGARMAGRVCSGLVALASVLTLAEFVLQVNVGIDRLLLHGYFDRAANLALRPAANGTIAFVLLSGALLLLDAGWARKLHISDWAALLAAIIAVLALLGYAYDFSALYGLAFRGFMSLPGAVAFLLLSAGVLCVRPEASWARTLASSGMGGTTLRRLWPLALLIPCFGGWLASLGLRRGLYGPKGDMVLLTLVLMVLLSSLVFHYARWLDRADAARLRAEGSLRRSRDQWELSFSCMSGGLSYHDPDYNVISANQALRQMVGGDEVTGKKCYHAVHGTECPPDYCPMRRTLESGKSEWGEFFEPRLQRHLNVRTDPVIDKDGKIVSIVHVVNDVTERKRAEQVVRSMAAIVESSDDAITAADLDGNLISWNRAAERMYGYSAAEVMGKSIAVLAPPEFEQDTRALIERIREGGRILSFETERCHRNGTRFDVSVTVSPVHDEHGELVGSSAIARDITERKRTQQEIVRRGQMAQRARSELDAVLTCLGEGLYQIDRYGNVAYLNPAGEAILGYQLWEIRGKNLHDLVHTERPDGTTLSGQDCPLLQVIGSGNPLAAKRDYFQRADGSFVAVEYTSSPLHFEDEITGAVVSFRDISARVRAEEREREATRQIEAKSAEIAQLNAELEERVRWRTRELEVTNRELETFSYSVSHDLRAPLRSIDGFSHILLDEYADKLDEEGRHFLRRVRAASQHMGQLIDALLQLSRVTRSEMRLDAVDLSQLAADIIAVLRQGAGERAVEVSIAPNLRVVGDQRLLYSALQNLLSNAFKFTSRTPGAKVEFGSFLRDGATVYFVRDNGAGFEMEYAHKLFGAFQRLHGAQEFEGSGIGLATVQRIVRRHGGRIWAEGSPGRGATFYFTLGESMARSPRAEA